MISVSGFPWEKKEVHLYLIVLSGKSMEEKSLLQLPFPGSRHAITQRVERELLFHTFILAVAGTFAVLGKGHLLIGGSVFSSQHNGKTILQQLRDELANPTSISLPCPFSSFYEVGGMM